MNIFTGTGFVGIICIQNNLLFINWNCIRYKILKMFHLLNYHLLPFQLNQKVLNWSNVIKFLPDEQEKLNLFYTPNIKITKNKRINIKKKKYNFLQRSWKEFNNFWSCSLDIQKIQFKISSDRHRVLNSYLIQSQEILLIQVLLQVNLNYIQELLYKILTFSSNDFHP